MTTEIINKEVEGFQELMAKSYNYNPKGFRCPHGLRKISPDFFSVLKLNGLYDTSLLGYSPTKIGGIYEIPLTPCPEHPLMAFDSYHHFRFPLFSSSEKKVLKLWKMLTEQNTFINIFLDPLDLVTESRLDLLRSLVRNAKDQGFIFNQMYQLNDKLINSDSIELS